MKNVFIEASICYDRFGEYKAMMKEQFFAGSTFVYFMDHKGQHEFIPIKQSYSYKSIGTIQVNNANDIIRLLHELNFDALMYQDKTYLWGFNNLNNVVKSKMILDLWKY